ncbi:hypothetical protein BG004_006386 [Podila humilis]|nr:hypothetical protein BG004_006386 [Podila humilis]
MSSQTTPVVHQIPIDQIDFSPNVSSEAENFFQTDADIARAAARQGMVNYDKGHAIKVSSKILDMCQGFNIRRRPATTTTAAAGATVTAPQQLENGTDAVDQEKDQMTSIEPLSAGAATIEEDKAIANATIFTAESGHIARKIHLQSGKTMKTFHGHTGPVTRVAVYQTRLGQERLITGSWDKTIRIWDTETKSCLAILRGHTDFVKGLVVRPVMVDNKEYDHASSGGEGGEETKKKVLGHHLFSCSYDGTILHWDLESFTPYEDGRGGPWKGHIRGVNDLCLTIEDGGDDVDNDENSNDQEGKEYLYSAASADKTAQRLDLETKKVDTKLEHPDFVKSIVLGGPYVATGGRHESIRVWSIGTGKLVKEIKGHFDEVSSMVVIGSTLFSGSLDGTLRRWSLKDKDLVTPSPKDIVHALGDMTTQISTTSVNSRPVNPVQQQQQQPLHQQTEERKSSMVTEEEERELAELMGSDDDD